MPNYSGANMRWGFAKETTKNTRVAANKWHPIIQESMRTGMQPIFSEEIYSNEPFMRAPTPGPQRPGGQVSMELTAEVSSSLLDLAHGGKTTTGSGPYTHALSRSLGDLGSFTQHIVRPGLTTLEVWEYIGCMIAGWTLTVTPSRRLVWQMDTLANRADLSATAIATSYPSFNRYTPFTTTVEIATTELAFDSLSIGARTGVQAENQISSTNPGSQTVFETGQGSDVTGTMQFDYSSATESYYADHLAGTTRLIEITAVAGSTSLVLAGDVVFHEDPTPVITGKGKTKMQLPFRIVSGGSNAYSLTIINGESTI